MTATSRDLATKFRQSWNQQSTQIRTPSVYKTNSRHRVYSSINTSGAHYDSRTGCLPGNPRSRVPRRIHRRNSCPLCTYKPVNQEQGDTQPVATEQYPIHQAEFSARPGYLHQRNGHRFRTDGRLWLPGRQ